MKKKIWAVLTAAMLCVSSVPAVHAEETGSGQKTAKDVYIDNTVDNSKSYVTGFVNITGSGGTQAGYNPGVTVYENSASVSYSNPRSAEVQGQIDAAYTKVYNIANDIKNRGKSGEFHMSTSTSTGEVWDNRKYTTVEDEDAVLIGDSDYLQGAYGVNSDYTRTHIASGDYGKYTYYRVEANGWVEGWAIEISKSGNGTVSANYEEALSDTDITVTIKADDDWVLDSVLVKDSEKQITGIIYGNSGKTEETVNFKMPKSDVKVSVVFKQAHEHTLVKTDRVEPTCEEEGTEEFWTCSDCGKMFSDEAGTKEINEPVVIKALGHNWVQSKVIKEAACEEDGEAEYTCSRCGKTKTEVIKALGHNWGAWTTVKEATPDETGLEMRTCKNDESHTETREIPKIVISYENTEGDDSSYTKESGESVSFTFERNYAEAETFGHFIGVKVDDNELDESQYTAVSGSVVITLESAYLETLSAGKHTLTAMFDDADDVTVTFTINEKEQPKKETKKKKTSSPNTGDRLPVWPGIAVVNLLGILVLIVLRKKVEA